jgi:hypothetical protein
MHSFRFSDTQIRMNGWACARPHFSYFSHCNGVCPLCLKGSKEILFTVLDDTGTRTGEMVSPD